MISLLLIAIVISLLALMGVIVFFRNPRNKTNQYFGLMIFWTILWSLSSYLEDAPISKDYRIFFEKLDIASATFMVLFFYLFTENFPRPKIFPLRKKIIIYSFTFLLFILSFTNLIMKDFYFVDKTKTIECKRGMLFWVYFSFIIFCLGTGLKNLIFKYKQSKGIERLQFLYVLLGVTIVIFTTIPINVIFPQFIFIPPLEVSRLGIYSILFFCFFTTLAILKYHLLGIKVILTEILIGVMGIILFLQLVFAQNFQWRVFNFLNFLLFLIFSYYLVKSVYEEKKRREEAERLAQKEREFAQILEEKIKEKTKELEEAKVVLEIKVAARTKELRELAENLDQQVKEKTKELQDRVIELERLNKFMIGRELKMVELKEEIKRLREELKKYKNQKN